MGSIKGEVRPVTIPVKILLDTNIIIDFALERQPYLEAIEQILLLAEQGRFEAYISASTFSDLYYIIRKQRGRDWVLDFLKRLVKFCKIAAVNEAAIRMALTANFRDFEDAIQYGAAVTNGLDVIVTRNQQDFTGSALRILTPNLLIEGLTSSP